MPPHPLSLTYLLLLLLLLTYLLITHVAASLSVCVSVLVGSALAAQLSDLGEAGDSLDPLQELGEEKLIEKLSIVNSMVCTPFDQFSI